MKSILLTILLVGTFAYAYAQKDVLVKFEKEESKISEKYDTSGIINHDINIIVEGKPTKSTLLKAEVLPISSYQKSNVRLLKDIIEIDSTVKKISLTLEIKNDTIQEDDDFIILKIIPFDSLPQGIKIENDGIHKVRVKNASKPTGAMFIANTDLLSADFRIDIGTNFDFLDEVDANGIYANVLAFAPYVSTIKYKTKNKKESKKKKKRIYVNHEVGFGIMAGLYQNRSITDSTSFLPSTFTSITPIIDETTAQDDTIRRFSRRRVETNITSSRLDNTGLYFTPMIELQSNENFGAFLGINMEVIRRKRRTELSYIQLSIDTIEVGPNDDPVRPRRLVERPFSETINYEGFFGLKLPMIYRIKDVDFMLIPAVGLAVNNYQDRRNWYYGFSFTVLERNSGLNLGGEIRGYFPAYAPLINIYLSKAFNVGAIGKYKP